MRLDSRQGLYQASKLAFSGQRGIETTPVKPFVGLTGDTVSLRFAGVTPPGGKKIDPTKDVTPDQDSQMIWYALRSTDHPGAALVSWPITLMLELLKNSAVQNSLAAQGVKYNEVFQSLTRRIVPQLQAQGKEKLPADQVIKFESLLYQYAAEQGQTTVTPLMIWRWLLNTQPSKNVDGMLMMAGLTEERIQKLKEAQTVAVPAGGKSSTATAAVQTSKEIAPGQNAGADDLGGRPSKEEILALETCLKDVPKKVIGQGPAITKFLTGVKTAKLGYDKDSKDKPNMPKVRAMLLGPSGVGKTYSVEELGKIMGRKVIYVPLSQYKDEQEAKKFTGSGFGFIGSEADGSLAAQIIKARREAEEKGEPLPILLLDEIEKAHASIFDILMQVLDKGILEGGTGDKAYLQGMDVVMTSNIAQREIKVAKDLIAMTQAAVARLDLDDHVKSARKLVKEAQQEFANLNVAKEAEVANALLAPIVAKLSALDLAHETEDTLTRVVQEHLYTVEDLNMGQATPFKVLISALRDSLFDQIQDRQDGDTGPVINTQVAVDKMLRAAKGWQLSAKFNFKSSESNETVRLIMEAMNQSMARQIAEFDSFSDDVVVEDVVRGLKVSHALDVLANAENPWLNQQDDPRMGKKMEYEKIIETLSEAVEAEILENGGFEADTVMEKLVRKALEMQFRPEFIGRMNNIVVYETLSKKDTGKILDMHIDALKETVKAEDHYDLEIDPGLRDYILDKGFNETLGAREVIRLLDVVLNSKLTDARAELILEDKLAPAATMKASWENGRVKLKYQPKSA